LKHQFCSVQEVAWVQIDICKRDVRIAAHHTMNPLISTQALEEAQLEAKTARCISWCLKIEENMLETIQKTTFFTFAQWPTSMAATAQTCFHCL
jgi:hypothetical protein